MQDRVLSLLRGVGQDARATMDFAALFTDPAAWQVFASGQAKGELAQVSAPDGKPGVRLDYDFHGGGGFVVMRRVIALRLPDTFEIGFLLRGEGPPNHFEFKVASPGGANVWRHLRQDYKLPADWTDFRFHEREFPFAWGPAGGGAPSEVEAVEIVIAAGPGGKGSVELTDASLADQTLRAPHAVRASSHLTDHAPQAAFEPSPNGWRAAADDVAPWWSVDFGRSLRFGGVVIHWPEELPPRACAVEVSNDGKDWTLLQRMTRARGDKSHISAHGARGASSAGDFRQRRLRRDPPHRTEARRLLQHAQRVHALRWPPTIRAAGIRATGTASNRIGRRSAARRADAAPSSTRKAWSKWTKAGFRWNPSFSQNPELVSWADVKTSCAMAETRRARSIRRMEDNRPQTGDPAVGGWQGRRSRPCG